MKNSVSTLFRTGSLIMLILIAIFTAVSESEAASWDIASIYPDPYTLDVGLDAEVTIKFVHSVEQTAVENSLKIDPDTEVNIEWSGSQIMIISPKEKWQPETTYLFYLPAADDGAKLEPIFTFTSAGFSILTRYQTDTTVSSTTTTSIEDDFSADGDRPYIVTVLPEENQTDVSLKTEIRITFNVNMEKNSVEEGFSIEPPAYGSYRWQGTSIIFHPAHSLISSTKYTIRISGNVRDSGGDYLGEDYIWNFTTTKGASDSTSDEEGYGCFIATAAYDTKTHPVVVNLIAFRDNCLLQTELGKAFVNLYYRYSPVAAEFISQHPILKSMVRAQLVPLRILAWITQHSHPIVLIGFGFCFGLIGLVGRRYRRV